MSTSLAVVPTTPRSERKWECRAQGRSTESRGEPHRGESGGARLCPTALLDRLEKVGFVYRERDTKDRRRIFVKASPKSVEVVWPMFKDLVSRAYRLLNQFRADEIKTILRFLKMNREIIREHLPPRQD